MQLSVAILLFIFGVPVNHLLLKVNPEVRPQTVGYRPP